MYKPSNLSYAKAMRTSKNRFTCNINPYRGTKISVVFKANLRSLASNFCRGVPPDLLQGFSSLLSSSGIPLAPSSKKLYLGPWKPETGEAKVVGATSMSGELNGVQKQIQDHFSSVYYNHCVAPRMSTDHAQYHQLGFRQAKTLPDT